MEDRSKKRQRRQVVSEQEYTSSLDTIIQRDYYSDLPELQLKMAVLHRRSQKDREGAVRIRRAARKLKNHEEALMDQEEADEFSLDGTGFRKTARPLHRENLTGFHSRVTSEDNVGFERTQKKEIAENRERLAIRFQTPGEQRQQQLLLKENGEGYNATATATATGGNAYDYDDMVYPGLASDEFNPPRSGIHYTAWEKPHPRNGLFFVPSPGIHSGRQAASITRTNTTSSSRKTDYPGSTGSRETDLVSRSLMPPPSQTNNQTITSSVPSTAKATHKQALVEYIPKHKVEKRIEPSQTRFPMTQAIATCLQSRRAITSLEQPGKHNNKQQQTASDLDTEYSTDASTDLDVDGRSLQTERRSRVRHQTRELHSYVEMTPLVVSGGSGQQRMVGDSVAAWGACNDTPLMVQPVNSSLREEENDASKSKSATTTTSFSVAEEDCRELAARGALTVLEKRKARATQSNSGSASKRADATARNKSAKSRSKKRPVTTNRQRTISSFSPAAMSLLAKISKQRNPTARSGSAFASALRASYTPQRLSTSSRNRGSSNRSTSSKGDHAYKTTPRIFAGLGRESEKMKEGDNQKMTIMNKAKHITDGLLNLP